MQRPYLPLRGDTAAKNCSEAGQGLVKSIGSGPLQQSAATTHAHRQSCLLQTSSKLVCAALRMQVALIMQAGSHNSSMRTHAMTTPPSCAHFLALRLMCSANSSRATGQAAVGS
jgi:hypothetical protein